MKKWCESGITLIALIITIIVLLILAGVTISLVVGDNGILNKSREAKNNTVISQEKEQINLAYSTALTKNVGDSVTSENLQTELDMLVGSGKTEVSINDDETLNVLFNDTGHNYTTDGYSILEVELFELHIRNYNELLDFANRVNDGESFDRYIVYLDNDITIEDDDWVMIGTPGDEELEPMIFSGVFEGNNHTISGLILSSNYCMGLFCFNGGTIKNLNVEAIINTVGNCYVGGICCENSNKIINCCVNIFANIRGTSRVGGICSDNCGLIDKCITRGNIIEYFAPKLEFGGISGYNDGIIKRCKNETSIAVGSDSEGIIIGPNSGLGIVRCAWKEYLGECIIGGIVNDNYRNN